MIVQRFHFAEADTTPVREDWMGFCDFDGAETDPHDSRSEVVAQLARLGWGWVDGELCCRRCREARLEEGLPA